MNAPLRTYEVYVLIYKRGEMWRRPFAQYLTIEAKNPNEAREEARSIKYSSLSDVVKIMRLTRIDKKR